MLHEIDVNLLAHQLIKIRVFGDDRGRTRGVASLRICDGLDAAPVQHLGKVLTIWRPVPPPEPEPVAPAIPAQGPGTRLEGRCREGTQALRPPSRRRGHRSEARAAPRAERDRGHGLRKAFAAWGQSAGQEARSQAPASSARQVGVESRGSLRSAPPPQGALT